ncbi:MAG: DUF3592 domain-containing protein [Oculatellaceae cyanobacterium bins.114]|nr:DUF3592 domain-containing protein [Oculatellaceae cyanobacterium bins.114]
MFFALFVLKLLAPVILGAIVGLSLIGMACSGFWKSRQTRRWQTTSGKVISTMMKEQRVKTRLVYQPKVRYEYVVDRNWYQANRIRVGDRWGGSDFAKAEEQLRRYQPGTEVTVYYNPRRPQDAVLELKIDPALYMVLAGGGFFLCISLSIGSAILPSAMQTCGITPSSTHAKPGAPMWCQRGGL